ncbi:MAG: hypothetical protein EOP38_10340 [Rubrivivax sp.]|nr:MAG: hypothetical protein EOP38_10340 [Rubrivivax sp.]
MRPASPQSDQEAALAAWDQWCAQHAGAQCELALSGHWLMACAAPPDQALQQWDHYMGLSAATMAQAWVLRSVETKPFTLACAAPLAFIDGLRKVAAQHKVTLAWVGPWWARPVQRWLAGAPQSGEHLVQAREPGLSTYFRWTLDSVGKKRMLVWTEVGEGSAGNGGAGITDIVAEVAADVAVAEWAVQGASSWRATWADALDFVGPRVRTALWSWALLVAGLAACMAVSEQVKGMTADRDEAQAMLHRLERARHQQVLAATAPRAAPSSASQPSTSALDDVSLRQTTRITQQLAYPWAAVIERVEQSALQEQAVLTGFNLDIASPGGKSEARPQIRLQAALRDDAAVLRWVAAHGEDAQLLGRDALATPFDSVKGHYALRAEAVWLAEELLP